MRPNTKLTVAQKSRLKEYKEFSPATLMDNGETVIAFQEKGNTVEFALSIMSPNEKKFRRKVGQYHALERFTFDYVVKMKKEDFYIMLADVFYIYI